MKKSNSKYLDWTIRIIEISGLIFIGVLAFKVNETSNKIANSQLVLNKNISHLEQQRKNTQMDAHLLDLFGRYYFGDKPGQKEFAIKVINEISGQDLKKALAYIILKELGAENTELREELKEITEMPPNWRIKPPNEAWCYQEDRIKPGPGRFLIHCHWSEERCKKARVEEGKWRKTECVFIKDLDKVDWNPGSRGWMDAWYQYSDKPFPPPFPQFK